MSKVHKKSSTKECEKCFFAFDCIGGALIKRKASTGVRIGEKRVRGSEDDCVIGLTLEGSIVKWWGSQLEWNVPAPPTIDEKVFYILDPSVTEWVIFYADGSYSYLDTKPLIEGRRTKSKKRYLSNLHDVVFVFPLKDLFNIFLQKNRGYSEVDLILASELVFDTSPKKRTKLRDYIPFDMKFNVTSLDEVRW